jgi:hypothetical protein
MENAAAGTKYPDVKGRYRHKSHEPPAYPEHLQMWQAAHGLTGRSPLRIVLVAGTGRLTRGYEPLLHPANLSSGAAATSAAPYMTYLAAWLSGSAGRFARARYWKPILYATEK